MSTGSEAATPCLSEVDTVTDLLDRFYYSTVWGDEESIEEQEDINFYGLYGDHCSPLLSCPKSPPPGLRRDVPVKQPFDQKLLAEKLWSYMESAAHSNPPGDSKHEKHKSDCAAQNKTITPIGTSKAEPREPPSPGGPTTRHCQRSNHDTHENQ